jgi:hypothetical protein
MREIFCFMESGLYGKKYRLNAGTEWKEYPEKMQQNAERPKIVLGASFSYCFLYYLLSVKFQKMFLHI